VSAQVERARQRVDEERAASAPVAAATVARSPSASTSLASTELVPDPIPARTVGALVR
jgi:hypothetical protein